MDRLHLKEQVEIIRESFGYVNRFKGRTFVIKVDSSLISHPFFPLLVKDIVHLNQSGIHIVLVPGARTRIDEVLVTYGIKCRTVNGVRVSTSKAIAAGLRVGFLRVPPAARQRIAESLIASCLCVPPLMPELFMRWLDDGTIVKVIARRRADVASRQKLAESIFAGFTFRNQPSSYHLWLMLPEGQNSMKLAMEAQLRGVTIMPGLAFSADPKPAYEAARISLVVPPTEKILADGLNIIADLLRETSGYNFATV